jgi:hypothetical protein
MFKTSWRRNKHKQLPPLGPKPTGNVQLLPSRMQPAGIQVGLLASIFRSVDILLDKIKQQTASHE